MSNVTSPIILDETGQAIVDAITQSGLVQDKITQINNAGDAKIQEIIETVVVDPTLSVEGVAADAKATGAAVNDLKSAIEWTLATTTTQWLRNAYSVVSGGSTPATNRIRTGSLDQTIKLVDASPYEIAVFAYQQDGTYEGVWNGTEFVKSSDNNRWATSWNLGYIEKITGNTYTFKLVLREKNDSDIEPDIGSAVKLYCSTDKTFSQTGVAPDSELVGYEFDNVNNKITNLTETLYSGVLASTTIDWEQNAYSVVSGASVRSTNRIRTGILDASIKAIDASPYEIAVFAYQQDGTYEGVWNGTEFVKSSDNNRWATSWNINSIIEKTSNSYNFKVVLRDANDSDITPGIGNIVKLYGIYNNNITNKASRSYAINNALASNNQFLNVEYTPIRPLPVTNSQGYVNAGTKCKGLPYSSTRSVCKYIGQHVTFYTFLSALQNPESVLYKRRIKYGTLGKTYYGVTCFTYVSYSHGSRLGYFDNEVERHGDPTQYETVSPYDVQIGDTLFNSPGVNNMSHCAVVQDLHKDVYGRITHITISEAHPPFCESHKNVFLVEGDRIVEGSHRYMVHRLKNRVDRRTGMIDYGSYEKIGFVNGYEDEVPEALSYPDIMSEYGDRACIEAGIDVTINVLSSSGYDAINIYKDDVLIETKGVADFTIDNISYGTYRFVLTGNSKTSESSLIVADVHGTFDSTTNIITFSSANAEPVFAASYGDWESAGDNVGVQYKIMRFNSAELQNGSANVADLIKSSRNNIQIGFLTEYGVAMWWSKKLEDEWEYWTPPTN